MKSGGEGFVFSGEDARKAASIVARFPEGRRRGAVVELLSMGQSLNQGWLSPQVLEHVAGLVALSASDVRDIASFYGRFNLEPAGQHVVQVCMGRSCRMRGADAIMQTCCEALGIEPGQTTPDGAVTLKRAFCLGGCSRAPVVDVDEDLHAPVSVQQVSDMLADLQKDGDA
ncbi:MAG: hypothetical protein A2018_04525 [Alphaproteobacteria bacterium GWF2_58_20]|nr:MAG: hypothetical protein A2018_04525 [Alphaproteobacteria bacterium GWF2_58_20]